MIVINIKTDMSSVAGLSAVNVEAPYVDKRFI
jgi:hypothetical protein